MLAACGCKVRFERRLLRELRLEHDLLLHLGFENLLELPDLAARLVEQLADAAELVLHGGARRDCLEALAVHRLVCVDDCVEIRLDRRRAGGFFFDLLAKGVRLLADLVQLCLELLANFLRRRVRGARQSLEECGGFVLREVFEFHRSHLLSGAGAPISATVAPFPYLACTSADSSR